MKHGTDSQLNQYLFLEETLGVAGVVCQGFFFPFVFSVLDLIPPLGGSC